MGDEVAEADLPQPRVFKRAPCIKEAPVALRRLLSHRTVPEGRPDLDNCIPDDDDVKTLLDYIERELPKVKARPEVQQLIQTCGLTDDDIGMLLAYKIEHPYAVYRWLNGFLTCTRRDPDVVECVGPAFTLLYRAMEKLPLVTANAQRAALVRNIPGLRTKFDNYRDEFAPGKQLSFWGFSSFTKEAVVMSKPSFCGKPDEDAFVYVCGQLTGVDMEPFKPVKSSNEAELLPLCPAVFHVTAVTKLHAKVFVTLEQEANDHLAYVQPKVVSTPAKIAASSSPSAQPSSTPPAAPGPKVPTAEAPVPTQQAPAGNEPGVASSLAPVAPSVSTKPVATPAAKPAPAEVPSSATVLRDSTSPAPSNARSDRTLINLKHLRSLTEKLRLVWEPALRSTNRVETLRRLAHLIELVTTADKTIAAAEFNDIMANLGASLTTDGVFGQSLMEIDNLQRSPWLFEQFVGVLQARLNDDRGADDRARRDSEQRIVLLDGSTIPDASVLLQVTCLAIILAAVRHGVPDDGGSPGDLNSDQISQSVTRIKKYQRELSRLASLHSTARSMVQSSCEVFAARCMDLAEALDDVLPHVEQEQRQHRGTLNVGNSHRKALEKMAEQMPPATYPDSWFKQLSTSVRRYHQNRTWHWPTDPLKTTVRAEEKAKYDASRNKQMAEQRRVALDAVEMCSELIKVLRPQLFSPSVVSLVGVDFDPEDIARSEVLRKLAKFDKSACDIVVRSSKKNGTPCEDELLRHVLLHCGPMVSATGDGPLLQAVRRLFAAGHDAVYALNMVQLLGLGYITQTYEIDQASKKCVLSIGYRCFGEEQTFLTVFRVTLDYTPPPYMTGDEAVWAWWLTSDVPASETPVRHGNRQKQLDDWGHAACNGGMSGHKGGEYSGTATEHFLPVASTTRVGALDTSFPLPPSDPSVAIDNDGVATLTEHHTKALAAFRKRCATSIAQAVSLSGEAGGLQKVLRSFEAASRELFLVATFACGPDNVPTRAEAFSLTLHEVQRRYAEVDVVAADGNPAAKIREVATFARESLAAALGAYTDGAADTGFGHLDDLQGHVATFLAVYDEPTALAADTTR